MVILRKAMHLPDRSAPPANSFIGDDIFQQYPTPQDMHQEMQLPTPPNLKTTYSKFPTQRPILPAPPKPQRYYRETDFYNELSKDLWGNLQHIQPTNTGHMFGASQYLQNYLDDLNLNILTNPNPDYQKKVYIPKFLKYLEQDPKYNVFKPFLTAESNKALGHQAKLQELQEQEKQYDLYGIFKKAVFKDLQNLASPVFTKNMLKEPSVDLLPNVAEFIDATKYPSQEFAEKVLGKKNSFLSKLWSTPAEKRDDLEKAFYNMRIYPRARSKDPLQNLSDANIKNWMEQYYTQNSENNVLEYFDRDLENAVSTLHKGMLSKQKDNAQSLQDAANEHLIGSWNDDNIKNIFKRQSTRQALSNGLAKDIMEYLKVQNQVPKTLAEQPQQLALQDFILGNKNLNEYLSNVLQDNETDVDNIEEVLKNDLKSAFLPYYNQDLVFGETLPKIVKGIKQHIEEKGDLSDFLVHNIKKEQSKPVQHVPYSNTKHYFDDFEKKIAYLKRKSDEENSIVNVIQKVKTMDPSTIQDMVKQSTFEHPASYNDIVSFVDGEKTPLSAEKSEVLDLDDQQQSNVANFFFNEHPEVKDVLTLNKENLKDVVTEKVLEKLYEENPVIGGDEQRIIEHLDTVIDKPIENFIIETNKEKVNELMKVAKEQEQDILALAKNGPVSDTILKDLTLYHMKNRIGSMDMLLKNISSYYSPSDTEGRKDIEDYYTQIQDMIANLYRATGFLIEPENKVDFNLTKVEEMVKNMTQPSATEKTPPSEIPSPVQKVLQERVFTALQDYIMHNAEPNVLEDGEIPQEQINTAVQMLPPNDLINFQNKLQKEISEDAMTSLRKIKEDPLLAKPETQWINVQHNQVIPPQTLQKLVTQGEQAINKVFDTKVDQALGKVTDTKVNQMLGKNLAEMKNQIMSSNVKNSPFLQNTKNKALLTVQTPQYEASKGSRFDADKGIFIPDGRRVVNVMQMMHQNPRNRPATHEQTLQKHLQKPGVGFVDRLQYGDGALFAPVYKTRHGHTLVFPPISLIGTPKMSVERRDDQLQVGGYFYKYELLEEFSKHLNAAGIKVPRLPELGRFQPGQTIDQLQNEFFQALENLQHLPAWLQQSLLEPSLNKAVEIAMAHGIQDPQMSDWYKEYEQHKQAMSQYMQALQQLNGVKATLQSVAGKKKKWWKKALGAVLGGVASFVIPGLGAFLTPAALAGTTAGAAIAVGGGAALGGSLAGLSGKKYTNVKDVDTDTERVSAVVNEEYKNLAALEEKIRQRIVEKGVQNG